MSFVRSLSRSSAVLRSSVSLSSSAPIRHMSGAPPAHRVIIVKGQEPHSFAEQLMDPTAQFIWQAGLVLAAVGLTYQILFTPREWAGQLGYTPSEAKANKK